MENRRIDYKKFNTCGRYDFPVLRASNDIPYNLLPFNHAKTVRSCKGRWIHFFIEDYQFERLWTKPYRYFDRLHEFDGVIAPNYSMWSDMPIAEQIYNVWRNRVLSRWMQEIGLSVIPSVEWSDKASLEWCLDGIPKRSTIAMQTNGVFKSAISKMSFIKGMEVVCRELEPSLIVFYGRGKKEYGRYFRNAIWFDSYSQSMKKRLEKVV